MRIELKIKKFIKTLTDHKESDGLFILESSVKRIIPISLDGTDIPFFDLLSNNGSVESCLSIPELLEYLHTTKEVQDSLNPQPKKTIEKVPANKRLSLPSRNMVMVSHDTLDCLKFIFPSELYDLSFGLTVQLKELLTRFRMYNNNDDMSKGDLSRWLLNTGLFFKTPTSLFTYVNMVPLDKLESSPTPDLPGTIVTEESQGVETETETETDPIDFETELQ